MWGKALNNSFIILLLIVVPQITISQESEQEETRVYEFAEQNQECLKCHGQEKYFYYNDWIERDVKENMNPYYIIDSALFYQSNHWSFKCIDCHSSEYETFPHPGELRMEPKYTCLDCHEGDDNFAEYHFERIDEEFHMSVHSTKHDEEFTCWMCHDPHTYKINARTNLSIKDIIKYDNEICLSCHSNTNKYQLLTEQENPNVIESHDWLPNQKSHFQHVRCIECHAEYNEDILVAHNVQPKEKAVKLCVECHSENSILTASLYRYKVKETRSNIGFHNAIFMMEETYVIGANRNTYLNRASLVIFFLTLAGIGIHSILRFLKR